MAACSTGALNSDAGGRCSVSMSTPRPHGVSVTSPEPGGGSQRRRENSAVLRTDFRRREARLDLACDNLLDVRDDLLWQRGLDCAKRLVDLEEGQQGIAQRLHQVLDKDRGHFLGTQCWVREARKHCLCASRREPELLVAACARQVRRQRGREAALEDLGRLDVGGVVERELGNQIARFHVRVRVGSVPQHPRL